MITYHDCLQGHVQLFSVVNKHGDATFYARWTIRGEKRRIRRLGRTERHPTTASLRDHEARFRVECQRLEQEILSGQVTTLPVEAPRATIAESQADYLAFLAGPPAQASFSSIRRRRQVFTDFRRYIGSTVPTVDLITADHLTGKGDSGTRPGFRYAREAMEISPATISCELYDLKGWLDYCEERGWIKAVPRMDHPAIPQRPRPTVPTDEQVYKAITNEATPRRTALRLLALTGMRQGELKVLDVAHFDPTARTISVPPGMETNKRHARTLPVGPAALDIVNALALDQPADAPLCRVTDGQRLTWQLNSWLESTGLTPHDLRRWFQTTLTREGCPQDYIDELMGHAGSATNRAYVAATLDDLRPWMAKVETHLFPASPTSLDPIVTPEEQAALTKP